MLVVALSLPRLTPLFNHIQACHRSGESVPVQCTISKGVAQGNTFICVMLRDESSRTAEKMRHDMTMRSTNYLVQHASEGKLFFFLSLFLWPPLTDDPPWNQESWLRQMKVSFVHLRVSCKTLHSLTLFGRTKVSSNTQTPNS